MAGETARVAGVASMAGRDEGRPTREVPFVPERTALLIIDLQNYFGHRDSELYKGLAPDEFEERYGYFFGRLEGLVLPNIRRLEACFRAHGCEVIFTLVESLTQDGRDRSLDYKITGFHVPKGTWGARVLEPIAPVGDEIVIPKTASSVFNATSVEYVLRNLGIEYLALCGALTDQCIDSAVRDAADRGFLVTVVEDACAGYDRERHEAAIRLFSGYCRTRSTDQVIAELTREKRKAG